MIVLAQVLGPSLPNTIIALTAFSIPAVARIARSSTMKVMSMPYLQAAQLAGSPWWRILFRHIVPNIVPQLTNFLMLGMAIVIVTEGALSFLGLGIPHPTPVGETWSMRPNSQCPPPRSLCCGLPWHSW
ncbi:ABC transporter permease subunit [Nesterenkonia pannonica]|uniref:ABC transporter permease n=1 Tax=Nesterenkonia pannonica TaxID=1548602 RepID=UPI002164672F|nr:ABC transporter permease subunit [Nesterenkonia pannonica]